MQIYTYTCYSCSLAKKKKTQSQWHSLRQWCLMTLADIRQTLYSPHPPKCLRNIYTAG